MVLSLFNPTGRDLSVFAKGMKATVTKIIKKEIQELKSVKVSFGLEAEFSKEAEGEDEIIKIRYYFFEKEPHVLFKEDWDKIGGKFDKFIERTKEEIKEWSKRGSGWNFERVTTIYINIARFQPLCGGTYLQLPAALANKKAIINVQNKDNKCLKWVLRAALFPPADEKNSQRPSK